MAVSWHNWWRAVNGTENKRSRIGIGILAQQRARPIALACRLRFLSKHTYFWPRSIECIAEEHRIADLSQILS